jgi:hypothetical protein
MTYLSKNIEKNNNAAIQNILFKLIKKFIFIFEIYYLL